MLRANRTAFALVTVLFLSIACHSCRPRSDTDAVAAVLEDMAACVEKKDAAGLIAHLAENYADFEGRDRIATQTMAEEYFRRYRGIKTKMLSSRIAMGADGSAKAEIDVSLFSGVGAALRKAVGFRGENYRVSCVLRKDGRWRVGEARWEFIPMSGLFPESIKVLQELFPGQ